MSPVQKTTYTQNQKGMGETICHLTEAIIQDATHNL